MLVKDELNSSRKQRSVATISGAGTGIQECGQTAAVWNEPRGHSSTEIL